MTDRTLRRLERFGVYALALLAILTGIMAASEPGISATGTTGPANVSVTPTSGLSDGQTVAIHAEVADAELFEIRANVCRHSATAWNRYKFSSQYSLCAPQPVSAAADAEIGVVIPQGQRGGDLNFHVGVGSVSWTTNEPLDPPEGATHTLTCGPDSACDLVVQLQVTDNTVFYPVPLCFGGTCPVAGGGDLAPAAAAAAALPSESAPSEPAAAAAPTLPNGAAAPKSGKGGAVSEAGASTRAGSDVAAARSSDTTSEPSESTANAGLAAAVIGTPDARRVVRVFSAGMAGVIGGCVIALILIRTRRRLANMEKV